MNKKRLKDALQASRLFSLGFNLNHFKPQNIELLYTVNSFNSRVLFADEEAKSDTRASVKFTVSDEEDSASDSEQTKSTNESDDKTEILSLKFNEASNLLATGDSNGKIKVYDIFSGLVTQPSEHAESQVFTSTEKKNISNSEVYNMPTVCVKWYPYSNYSLNILFFAHVNGYIGILDKNTLKKKLIIEEEEEISCIDFNQDGSFLASVGKDAHVRLYDTSMNGLCLNKALVRTYGRNVSNTNNFDKNNESVAYHSNRLQSVKFSNKSNDIFLTGGWDRTVKVWDKRTPTGIVDTIHGPFIGGSDAIDIKDYSVLTASWVKEKALELWDLRNVKKSVRQFKLSQPSEQVASGKSGEYLYACQFYSSSSLGQKDLAAEAGFSTALACGSGTQSLHLFDYNLSEKPNLSTVYCNSPLYCLDTIYSSSLIATGGMSKIFTLMTTGEKNVKL